MSKIKFIALAIGVGVFVLGLVLGLIINERDVVINKVINVTDCNEKLFDGCWADVKEDVFNEEGKIIATINKEDWVCVNVKGMDYERAIEVCNHEVGHEIFAETCEKNITKCLEVME